jgi:hypothetical protein
MYVHLIRATKFFVPQKNHMIFINDFVFELPPNIVACTRLVVALFDNDE